MERGSISQRQNATRVEPNMAHGNLGLPVRRTGAELPAWRGEAPQPPLGPSEFTVAIANQELKKLIADFRKNQCEYAEDGDSCFDTALRNEQRYQSLGNRLRSLWSSTNFVPLHKKEIRGKFRSSTQKLFVFQLVDMAGRHARNQRFAGRATGSASCAALHLLQ